MMDWLLSTALNLTVLALTTLVGGAALLAGYWGVVQLIQGSVSAGSTDLAVSFGLAMGAWGLVRNINDLVDR
jgi:hypothetical protein